MKSLECLVALLIAIAPLHAAAADPAVVKTPQAVGRIAPGSLTFKTIANEKGDAATAWVSPQLDNHDSKISGKPYTINSGPLKLRFGFSIVNIDALTAIDVALTCYDPDGRADPKYAKTFTVRRFGSADWNTFGIEPTRSADDATPDWDRVWCSLSSAKPFVAFGWRTQTVGPNEIRQPVSLVAVAR